MGSNIAIIGAGISGLAAAYWLHPEHRVTVFESGGYPGGHTNTVTVDVDGETQRIDTGFIVFNNRTYPHFSRLLDELRVAYRPTTMSFSIRDDRSGLEYNGHSVNSLFAQRRNLVRPSFYRMLFDIARFNRQASECDGVGGQESTVAEFLARHGYSRQFAEHYLLPMGAAIWSCPTAKFADFPIRFIAEFYKNHGLLQIRDRPIWQVIEGGSQTYVTRLIRGFEKQIRLNTPVDSVRRFEDRVEVLTAGGERLSFDRVIFACHSDQALRILGQGATAVERELLCEFPYERNVAILHTDESVLPRARRAWASWNYRVTDDAESPATVTYNMNLLQGLRSRHTFCVTLNDEGRIAPDRVLRRFIYHHPRFTTRRAAIQQRHPEVLTANRTSFCGAYWGNGFHEDGVNSALAVVNALRGDRRALADSLETRGDFNSIHKSVVGANCR